ncbi:hypothetical protein PVAP13_4NG312301 [Panicum virgatum]|uniref:Uncharacterized protein n=1 Tax=Panicum virgatum TaxID=38727 RepID=A0A8T0TGP8_PANVG|nr:hypothetical protein PVAP13_4NG312301 [Panicum virgatum]
MNPASRGISGVSLTPREKQKKKKKLLHFHFCSVIVLQMVEMPVEWTDSMGMSWWFACHFSSFRCYCKEGQKGRGVILYIIYAVGCKAWERSAVHRAIRVDAGRGIVARVPRPRRLDCAMGPLGPPPPLERDSRRRLWFCRNAFPRRLVGPSAAGEEEGRLHAPSGRRKASAGGLPGGLHGPHGPRLPPPLPLHAPRGPRPPPTWPQADPAAHHGREGEEGGGAGVDPPWPRRELAVSMAGEGDPPSSSEPPLPPSSELSTAANMAPGGSGGPPCPRGRGGRGAPVRTRHGRGGSSPSPWPFREARRQARSLLRRRARSSQHGH